MFQDISADDAVKQCSAEVKINLLEVGRNSAFTLMLALSFAKFGAC